MGGRVKGREVGKGRLSGRECVTENGAFLFCLFSFLGD